MTYQKNAGENAGEGAQMVATMHKTYAYSLPHEDYAGQTHWWARVGAPNLVPSFVYLNCSGSKDNSVANNSVSAEL